MNSQGGQEVTEGSGTAWVASAVHARCETQNQEQQGQHKPRGCFAISHPKNFLAGRGCWSSAGIQKHQAVTNPPRAKNNIAPPNHQGKGKSILVNSHCVFKLSLYSEEGRRNGLGKPKGLGFRLGFIFSSQHNCENKSQLGFGR